jgi:hypothetical protein
LGCPRIRLVPRQVQLDFLHTHEAHEAGLVGEAQQLDEARELHIRVRLLGVGCLLVGGSLLAAANLV